MVMCLQEGNEIINATFSLLLCNPISIKTRKKVNKEKASLSRSHINCLLLLSSYLSQKQIIQISKNLQTNQQTTSYPTCLPKKHCHKRDRIKTRSAMDVK